MSEQKLIDLLTYENPVLRNYAFWSSILIIKTVIMAVYTGVQRSLTKTYANPEDAGNTEVEVKFGEERVERVRRAHLNDLENILPFILVAFVYTLTNPIPMVAVNLFRVATGFRLWHTIVYTIFVIPQPARVIGFVIPLIIIIYMAVQSAIFFVN